MSQYVVLQMRGMESTMGFHTTISTARELFDKLKRCHEEPARPFFIETELDNGDLFLVSVIPQFVIAMATYPAEPPNKALVDVLKKSLDDGEDWKGGDDDE